ncbi:hypothetical protein ACQ4M3_09135 [Leptolyngbya sp. AN03gr2]|uniref:hypothetical protein n=1 Tax=unclassified Leptolyngbya TaxID=2650499 RepID=UPI003D3111C5
MNEMSLEQCYALLEVNPEVSIADLDAAYAKKVLEKIQQGAKQEKVLLKAAYDRIREEMYRSTQSDLPPLVEQITELIQQLNPEPFHVKLQADTIQIFFKTNAKSDYADFIYQQLSGLELPEIKSIVIYGMRSTKSVIWKKRFELDAISEDDCNPYSFKNRYILLLAFPVAICTAVLFQSLGFTKLLLFPFQLWVHEVGHAMVAWFSGRRAIPLPFGWTNVALERSLFVYFGILFLLGLLFYAGWKEKKRSTMILAVICAILQFVMTWIQSAYHFEMWLSFGGIGGEFYLSALMIAGFYFQLPNYWRWDFWRYPFIIVGANTFWAAFSRWQQIKKGAESIPWGSLLFGSGDSGGDMNQLSEVYNWSDQKIIGTYSALGNSCFIILISLYIFFVIKHRRWIVDRISSKPL